MNRLARRGLAVAATGLLALGLAACGGSDSSSSSGSDDTAADTAGGAEEEAAGALTCDDLSEQVTNNAPDDTTPIADFEDAKFDALAGWMVDNSGDFEDAALGEAVGTWGELGAGYFNDVDGTSDEPLSADDSTAFETASTTIDTSCPGLGFGFES